MGVFNHIIFDLDGTLTDSSEGIINSVLYALDKIGIREKDTEKLIRFIGPPLSESLRHYYGLTETDTAKTVALYREYFSQKGIYENRLYPGAREILLEIQAMGKEIYMATSKPTVYTHRILKRFGIQDYFSFVAGANLDGSLDHKPEIIGLLLQKQPHIDKTSAVMVGDRKYDLVGAHKNGLSSIGVTWGYGTEDELQAENPMAIAGSFEELLTLLV